MENLYKEVIHHHDVRHVPVMRDYMTLLKEKLDTKAKLLRLLEWKTARASQKWQDNAFERAERGEPIGREPDYWVPASLKWFAYHSYTSEDTVRKHLEELIRDGWIERRPDPNYGAPFYLLNREKIQHALDTLHEQERNHPTDLFYDEPTGSDMPEHYDEL
jgi:hypothetical protein